MKTTMTRSSFWLYGMSLALAGPFVQPLATAPAAEHWPSFRGFHSAGVADTGQPPISWDVAGGRNVSWSARIPGLGHSSPIVWDDRVFLTTAVALPSAPGDGGAGGGAPADLEEYSVIEAGARLSWRLYCLDRASGKILWERTAHEGIPRVKRHAKSSQASATPVTDGVRVMALMGSEGLFAYTMDGRLLWKRDLGRLDGGYVDEPEDEWGPASSPIIHGKLVIVQNDRQKDSHVIAFNAETGEEVWRANRNELPSWSTPVVHPGGRPTLVTNSPRFIRGHDPVTGEERWRIPDHTGPGGEGQVKVVTPVLAGDLVVVTGGYPAGGRPVLGIRAATGEVVWKLDRGSPYTPSPVVYRGILYICADNGVLSAYDVKTGDRLYQRRITADAGGFSASPIAADGRLYFASEDGVLYVVRAGRKFELLASNDMQAACLATPAVSGRLLLVRTRTHLHALTGAE